MVRGRVSLVPQGLQEMPHREVRMGIGLPHLDQLEQKKTGGGGAHFRDLKLKKIFCYLFTLYFSF